MMEKITIFMVFITNLDWTFAFFFLFSGEVDNLEKVFAWITVIFPCICGILYVLWTGFGNTSSAKINKVENSILEKKDKQKELEEKLKTLKKLS